MNQIHVDDISKTEKILSELKNQYHLKIPANNWVHKILDILKKLNGELAAIENPGEEEKYWEKFHKEHGEEHIYGMALLRELSFIYDHLDFKNQEKALLKKKLTKIFKAPLLPKDETNETNEFRNNLFELRLCAHVNHHFNLKAQLHDPNPDIIVPISENGKLKRTYFIECKRAFSFNEDTLKDRVVEAKSTLLKHLKGDEAYGIIALCVGRVIIPGWKEWHVHAKIWEPIKNTILQTVGSELTSFAKKFHEKISYLMDNPKIVAIIYEFQGIASEKTLNAVNITLFGKVSNSGYFDDDFPEDKKRSRIYIPNIQEVISILAPPERPPFTRLVVPAHLMNRYR